MSVSVKKQAILMSLDPLFREAEEKGLWFFHKSDEAGEIWCSPEYLQARLCSREPFAGRGYRTPADPWMGRGLGNSIA